MDAKDSVCKLIKALLEVGRPLKRDLLMDFIMGQETQQIIKEKLDDTESYGCGDNRDEEHWTLVIDTALAEGLLKSKSDGISPMVKGKKYIKNPKPFEIDTEDDYNESQDDGGLDELVRSALEDKDANKKYAIPIPISPGSQRTRQKLLMIQAIDRKLALDDFAESQGLGFDELLDELEDIIAQGTKVDITYFVEEVLGQECIDELMDYFQTAESDDIESAISEYGDVYQPEELRLVRILYITHK